MFKNLLLASAMSLAMIGTAQAQDADDLDRYTKDDEVCFRLTAAVDPTADNYVCYSEDEDTLTMAEEMAIARIIKIAQRRAEHRNDLWLVEHDRQQAIEKARLQQCTGMLMWKKCPSRTAEAEQYWQKKPRSACTDNPAGFACRDERKPGS